MCIRDRLRAADRHRRRVERRRTRVVALRRAPDRLHGHGDSEAGDVRLHVNRHGRRLNRRNRAVSAGIGGQNADFLLPCRRNEGEVNADVVVRRSLQQVIDFSGLIPVHVLSVPPKTFTPYLRNTHVVSGGGPFGV